MRFRTCDLICREWGVLFEPLLDRRCLNVLDELSPPLRPDVVLKETVVDPLRRLAATLRYILFEKPVDQRPHGDRVKVLLSVVRVDLDTEMFNRSLRIGSGWVLLDCSD